MGIPHIQTNQIVKKRQAQDFKMEAVKAELIGEMATEVIDQPMTETLNVSSELLQPSQAPEPQSETSNASDRPFVVEEKDAATDVSSILRPVDHQQRQRLPALTETEQQGETSPPVYDPKLTTEKSGDGTWHRSGDYIEHMLAALNQQRRHVENCDFTLQVQGSSFPVHKCVLAAASPYLQQRMQEAETQLSNVIVLDNISASCVGQFLDFLYVGKVYMDKESVQDLYQAGQTYQVEELELLCKQFTSETPELSPNLPAKEKSSQGHVPIACKMEPPDSEEFGKTLKALNDNLSNDSEFMTSLMANQNTVISEILAKLKDAPASKPRISRRKRTTPRRQVGLKCNKEPTKSTKAEGKTESKRGRKSKKVKTEPLSDHIDGVAEDVSDAAMKDHDFDNNDVDDEDDDEDDDITFDPKDYCTEGRRGGRRRLSRNIRTGKVLKNAKNLRAKIKKTKDPKEKRQKKDRKGRAIDTLKEKLESLTEVELAHLGIGKMEPKTDDQEFPYTVIGAPTAMTSFLTISEVQPVQTSVLDTSTVGNGVPSTPIVGPTEDNGAKSNYCIYCKSSFKSGEALLIHKEQMHRNIRCEHCNKLFIRQEHLSRHINKEHVKIFPDLICTDCNKEFKFTKKFMKHMEEEHNVLKPFKCQFEGCDSRFRNINQLGHHHNTHQTERNLICPTCGNTYRTKETLLCHMQRCRNVRDKLCDTCGAAFTNNQDLRQHIQIMHSGLRLYVCAVCGKDFSCPSNLRRHKRIHDNAFPYKCNSCPCSFRYSNTLKHHLQNKHNIQPPANSISFRERKQGGRPPGDLPGSGQRRKTIEISVANIEACRFPTKTQDHRVRSHDQPQQGGHGGDDNESRPLVGQRNHASQDPGHTHALQSSGLDNSVVAGGSGQHRTLECEINAAVQSIDSQHQINVENSNNPNVTSYTMASSVPPPLAVMSTYRNQPTSVPVNLGTPNNAGSASWPVGAPPPGSNMAAMLNPENATSTMIHHAHAMSALYHTPWGMGQH